MCGLESHSCQGQEVEMQEIKSSPLPHPLPSFPFLSFTFSFLFFLFPFRLHFFSRFYT